MTRVATATLTVKAQFAADEDITISCKEKEETMASKCKKTRAKWDSEVERQLIDTWADIMEEYSGQMMTRKSKEAIATTRLNKYVVKELNRSDQYTECEVRNKIDTIIKKGKGMYINYQKKGETGKEYTPEEADFDIDAAKAAWPNFRTFFDRFKDHPALGPGSVDDSTVAPPSVVAAEVEVAENESVTPGDSSRSHSRMSNRSLEDSEDTEEGIEAQQDIPFDEKQGDETTEPDAKKVKSQDQQVARVGKRKGKQGGASQFLLSLHEMNQQLQERQQEHERKMQQESLLFGQKMEQERMKFQVDLSSTMQQQSSMFQANLMKQNQLFQAELLKELLGKGSDK